MTFAALPTVPTASYGVLQRTNNGCSDLASAVEDVRTLGYAVLDAGYSAAELIALSVAFDGARSRYAQTYGASVLEAADEHNSVRLLLAWDDAFLRLALNEHLIAAVSHLIAGKFILNQQNGIVNPSRQTYNQGAWHRDLPYQHFISSTPLAINALFCIDDFTRENGATFVLPASHKSSAFPSEDFVQRHALQVEAKAGQFILLDCMLFHTGGYNASNRARRAVNHVFNIPYFKQQIRIPGNVDASGLREKARDVLGFDCQEAVTVADYLASRAPNQNGDSNMVVTSKTEMANG
ncbi:phytanoyl-CoA dioxygenase family protein [Variovorax arabinosiphilus]|uniref:phytanoyl-CoA dioxygenase family protein n=1 Tax=Variovorax arabinosiphilus TaxID=3053498 RepID=UPI00257778EA|nr:MULTISPECIES: phytanoyl-CoA dioxygenase family protein [unclassified Variovorax]MDM0122298.1 phytanoyl-CoA dioxygenase family protein [Variovorax sp. J2L1-78]MDM0131173.1 phytanoyl-CoA dioxygenase family protein [Variovorax sp. J2L1-63]MDM0235061.1 phytanoyl-CoA dioxygenase family protein [Variovorax sp. J2R1-6]